jgi:ATP/maltotriose-dependent transcriptional regulator MalT
LLEQAAVLTPTDDERTSRGIAAAEHHIRAGDRSRARELLEALLARPLPRPLRADALRLLGEVSYNDENIIEAVRLFTEALEHADDPRVANTIELGLAYVKAQLYDFFGSAPHAHSAMERAEAAPDHPLLAEALGYCAMFDYLCGNGVDWDKVERALALEDDESLLPIPWRPSTLAGLLCAYVGRHDEGRERLHAVWASAVERGDESDVAFIALWLSWLETRTGDLAAATVLVEQASAFADATGGQSTEAWTLAQRAYLHALRGDVADTRRACEEAAAALGRFEHVLARIWLAASLGLLELSLGNAEAAWRACEPLVMGLEGQGIPEPVPAFFLPDALEALIALGHLERAEALLDTFEARGRELDRAWALSTGARCRALLLAARGDVARAAVEVERALAEHERIDIPFELGRTLLVAGIIQRRQRQRGRAMASFQQAHELFARLGTRLWTERALSEIERVGLRRSSGVTLTPSERRVAELAAKGMSNREVAGALSVSPKTVEANLARVYRKLGISSRAELGAHMAKSLQE